MSLSTHSFSFKAAAAAFDPIVVLNDVWFVGASSMQGHFLAVGNGGTENPISNTVRAIWQPPLTFPDVSYTTDSGSKTVPPLDYTLNGTNTGRRLRNRGQAGLNSGTGAGTIDNLLSGIVAGFGASDFVVLHQGDNGVSATAINGIITLTSGYSSMKSRIGARDFLVVTNTQGGSGSLGSLAGEPAGGNRGILNDISTRIQRDLTPGKVVSFYETAMDNMDKYPQALTPNDLTDISQGLTPRSGMMDDGSHAIQPINNLLSDVLFTPLIDAVNGGAPFPVRQVVESVAPATPAINDNVGTIVKYGTGNLGLDASNTQTDYAVSTAGVVTRNTATLPAKDITWAQVTGTKAGKKPSLQKMVGIAERAPAGVSKLVEFNGSVILGQAEATKLANGPIITLLMRIQHNFTTGTDQLILTGAGTNWTVRLRNSGVIEVRYKNVSVPAVNVLSVDLTAGLFSPGSAPNGRWLAISIDMSDAVPANRKTQVTSWIDPAGTVFSNTTLLSGTDQPGNAGTVTCNIDRSSPWYIGTGAPSSKTTQWAQFRLGDYTYWNDFIDFTVLANRQEVSNTDGTPKTAWINANGVVATKTPYMHLSGNAADFRLCRFTGTGVPATPGVNAGELWGAGVRNVSFGNPGFLSTVP